MTILASVNNKTVMPGITPIADVPDAPTIGTATAGEASSSVTFTAATTGGTPTTFTATSNPGSITGTASSSPITVSGLTGGTSYTFTVTAANSTGTSPASAASNSVSPTQPIPGVYESLDSVTVSTAVSSIIFSGIPTGYKHLQLRWTAKTDRADTDDVVLMRFNSDTDVNYSWHMLRGNGSLAIAGAATSATSVAIQYGATGNSGATNAFAAAVVDVLEYANTDITKTVRSLQGMNLNGSGWIYLQSGNWRSNTPITSITLDQQYGSNFAQYSHFALYGVK